jgi:hypothetical protein
MAGQVIHFNVKKPERRFPIIPIGKRRETRFDIPQFGLHWERDGFSAERRVQTVGRGGRTARSILTTATSATSILFNIEQDFQCRDERLGAGDDAVAFPKCIFARKSQMVQKSLRFPPPPTITSSVL